MGVTEFREHIIQALITKANKSKKTNEGKLYKLINSKRGRCSNCYLEMVQQGGMEHAQKITHKVQTLCPGCSKYFCLECFFKIHSSKKK